MDIILVDTSVWINHFRDIKTKASELISYRPDQYQLATCPTIVQEVLQGISNDKTFQDVKSYLNNLLPLQHDGYEVAIAAAELYRALRKKGVTVRKPNDCLIAIYTIMNNGYLLHDDRDFAFIAQYSDLKLVEL